MQRTIFAEALAGCEDELPGDLDSLCLPLRRLHESILYADIVPSGRRPDPDVAGRAVRASCGASLRRGLKVGRDVATREGGESSPREPSPLSIHSSIRRSM